MSMPCSFLSASRFYSLKGVKNSLDSLHHFLIPCSSRANSITPSFKMPSLKYLQPQNSLDLLQNIDTNPIVYFTFKYSLIWRYFSLTYTQDRRVFKCMYCILYLYHHSLASYTWSWLNLISVERK